MANESAAFDRAAFERWRRGSRANARAFDEARTSWDLDLPIAATRYAADRDTATAQTAKAHWPARAAIAALVVALIGGLATGWIGHFYRAGHRSDETAQIATTANEARRFRLSDGSTVLLGTGSALKIAFADTVRSLTLTHGHARFEVAHDANRPFQVHAGNGIVTAHGTIFDVRLAPQGMRVILLRGAIDVERTQAAKPTGDVRRLTPGQSLVVPAQGVLGPVENAGPGIKGKPAMVSFNRTPLTQAIAQFNARNRVRIVFEDRHPQAPLVTGGFDIGNPQGFADMLASMFDLVMTHRADGTILLASKP
jgi:transmembrane sensor